MSPAAAAIIAPENRTTLSRSKLNPGSASDQIDPAMKPIAEQTTKAPCVHSKDVSIAQPAQSSRLAVFGGLGMSFKICRGTLGSLAMFTAAPWRAEVTGFRRPRMLQ